MPVCRTSLIMAALTFTIFLNDAWRDNTDNILTHVFLGLLTTMLFYGLCGYGYEMINWICLAVITILLLISGILAYINNDSNTCKEPLSTCCCKKPSCKPSCKPKCKVSKYN